METRKRILTGDRPTGPLHLGHYIGSLRDRVQLQDTCETFLLIADLHTLTTHASPEKIARLPEIIESIVLDYLAFGIDPEKVTIFLQSAVPQTAELALLLGNLSSTARLEQLPSLKDMARAAGLHGMTYGLLGYPVLMAADILLVRADLVPVGKDNEAHIELTHELARRFNHLYGETFPVPETLPGQAGTLPGTDGAAKMGKSQGNAILLSDSPETIHRKVMGMYTDPARIRADIPGTVEGNPVFAYLEAFDTEKDRVKQLEEQYRAGTIGDVAVKKVLIEVLQQFIAPFQARRRELQKQPNLVEDLLATGTHRAREEAAKTMDVARSRMGLNNSTRRRAAASQETLAVTPFTGAMI
ncbi:MAG: tryptophan--tRNA ligase [Anaerolineales bacterium]|nr:tryptophan--tRNA ligase [Anaerolineales bacterium]